MNGQERTLDQRVEGFLRDYEAMCLRELLILGVGGIVVECENEGQVREHVKLIRKHNEKAKR